MLEFSRKSRNLAKHHSFTKSPWEDLKKSIENSRKKSRAAVVTAEPDVYWSQSELEGYMNGTISRSSWSENNLDETENLFPFMEES